MKSVTTGMVAAIVCALAMWWLAIMATRNLGMDQREVIEIALAAAAGFTGFIAGMVACHQSRQHHAVFLTTTSGALAGGICGGAFALAMTAGYVTTFGGQPVNPVDWAAVILAYPVFAGLGAVAGLVPGSVIGMAAGYLLSRAG